MEGIPGSADIGDEVQQENQHIVGDHTGPGRNQTKAQHLGADKGAHNPYTPHARYVEYKGDFCFAHTLKDAFDYAKECGLETGAWTVDFPIVSDFLNLFGIKYITTNRITQ